MATRKPVFINTATGTAYPDSMSSTDTLTTGSATFTGVGGVAVDAGTNRIVNVVNPTAAQDAATKSYVDSAVSVLKDTGTSSGAVGLGAAVYPNANNTLAVGDPTVTTKVQIIGISTAAVATATSFNYIQAGKAVGVLTGATVGSTYYMGASGLPVLIASLASGNRLIQLGTALNATDLLVRIQDIGTLP